MGHRARLYVLMLGLAAGAGWLLGLVLLPLAGWAVAEIAYTAGEGVTRARLPRG